MHSPARPPACRRGGFRRNLIGWLLFLSSHAALPLSADVIHLKSGGTVEGQIVEQTPESVTVRTGIGTVRLAADAIDRIEPGETPIQVYDRRAAETADTPDAQAGLGAWCREQQLERQARRHYERAIELDPEHAVARQALGFVRVGGLWVKGSGASQPAAASRPADPPASRPFDVEAYVAAEQSRWRQRLQAVRRTLLESRLERSIENGLRQVREIQDPLAIVPLAEVLSESKAVVAREALVEALARFPQDESTLNLAVVALLDDSGAIRHRAIVELARREDERVVPQFREALQSDNSTIVRNAAEALAALKARPAIPDLIDALRAQERKRVEIPTRNYFGRLPHVFDRGTTIRVGGSEFTYGPKIGLPPQVSIFTTTGTRFGRQNVTVYRTEVLEALKAITGQNFGFDGAAWWNWYQQEHQP